ncbi:cytochrome P450 [Amycolatopsis sp. EV170708-02-1]|uniref:cytochrome P450 n=1 Tax=Amycolatopsis sp. EV170708-02-1 TaxID=2919322 RepID=UPI001F0B8DE2|nr:cytochrome P450 [Amycolatopsis sp. EV170708-02-1]UMP06722.1 cytochrome P450 [Amycolatopsis sp. EV170708-02-1]
MYHDASLGGWWLTGFAEVSSLMGDPRLIHPPMSTTGHLRPDHGHESSVENLGRVLNAMMLVSNPPKHTRLRRVFSHVFGQDSVTTFRPQLAAIADEVLEGLNARRQVDLVGDFAFPMATAAIMGFLGLAADDRDTIATVMPGMLAIIYEPSHSPNQENAAQKYNANLLWLTEYVTDLVDTRRHSPSADKLSQLIAEADTDSRISDEDLIVNIALVFLTAIPKIAYYLGNAMFTLLNHPQNLRDLIDGRCPAAGAAEELLRFESPVQIAVPQLIAEDISLNGHTLNRGDLVHLVLGAANRDPARFPDPDVLDLHRPPNHHLGFGVGLHNCLGAALAREQGQEIIPRFVRRFPGIHLDHASPEPQFRAVSHVRSLTTLPAVLEHT